LLLGLYPPVSRGWRLLPHHWNIEPTLATSVEPLGQCYEYIDGTFRPDVRRLLELLSGIELYGNELVSIRELLQNAFDAVREQIARECLERPNDKERAQC